MNKMQDIHTGNLTADYDRLFEYLQNIHPELYENIESAKTADILAIQKSVGVPLPAEYRELLQRFGAWDGRLFHSIGFNVNVQQIKELLVDDFNALKYSIPGGLLLPIGMIVEWAYAAWFKEGDSRPSRLLCGTWETTDTGEFVWMPTGEEGVSSLLELCYAASFILQFRRDRNTEEFSYRNTGGVELKKLKRILEDQYPVEVLPFSKDSSLFVNWGDSKLSIRQIYGKQIQFASATFSNDVGEREQMEAFLRAHDFNLERTSHNVPLDSIKPEVLVKTCIQQLSAEPSPEALRQFVHWLDLEYCKTFEEHVHDFSGAPFVCTLVARALLAVWHQLIDQDKASVATHHTVTAAQHFCGNQQARYWRSFRTTALQSYPFGPSQRCFCDKNNPNYTDCEPGSGCQSGIGFLLHLDLDKAQIMRAIVKELGPFFLRIQGMRGVEDPIAGAQKTGEGK